jgi:rare lipoprotein A
LKNIKYYVLGAILILCIGIIGFDESFATANIEKVKYSNEVVVNASVIKTQQINLIEKGEFVASWYGPKFHGKQTANGETYDQMAMTAAHKSWKFGTMLKITNPQNGKSAVVRINDRGPYINGRDIDLSKAAAKALGAFDKGVIKVVVEEISVDNTILAYN